jgi:fatty acid desaturase
MKVRSKAGIKELYAPSFPRWLGAVARDWATIVFTFWAIGRVDGAFPKLIACIVGSWVIGTRQHALAILGHDGAHGLACRTRWLNDWSTRLFCFGPLGVDLEQYEVFHRTHHLSQGSADDPELLFKELEGKWDLPLAPGRLARYVLTDLLGAGAPFAISLAVSLHPRNARGWLALLGWWGLALGAIAWSGCWLILGTWVFAFLTSFWCVFRLRMWTEHVGTPTTHCVAASWWQRAIFLPHSTWLHDVHHANVNIPCHHLERARHYYPAPTGVKTVEEVLGELCHGGAITPGTSRTGNRTGLAGALPDAA